MQKVRKLLPAVPKETSRQTDQWPNRKTDKQTNRRKDGGYFKRPHFVGPKRKFNIINKAFLQEPLLF